MLAIIYCSKCRSGWSDSDQQTRITYVGVKKSLETIQGKIINSLSITAIHTHTRTHTHIHTHTHTHTQTHSCTPFSPFSPEGIVVVTIG